jgi:hypothetical protein
MRLRNPGGADAALATVRQVKNQLENASVQGHNASERKDAFLTWCDHWTAPQLGNHFPASENLFAELAESYHRVLQTPQLSERELNRLLARERREWDARLEELIGEIQGRLACLARPGRLVVLDTSALMEGVFFTDFDWHLLDPSLNADAVRLVVPSLVVEELDDLRRHPGWSAEGAGPPGPDRALGSSPDSACGAGGTSGARGRHDRGAPRRWLAPADAEQRRGDHRSGAVAPGTDGPAGNPGRR